VLPLDFRLHQFTQSEIKKWKGGEHVEGVGRNLKRYKMKFIKKGRY